jgi:hypothetical protein
LKSINRPIPNAGLSCVKRQRKNGVTRARAVLTEQQQRSISQFHARPANNRHVLDHQTVGVVDVHAISGLTTATAYSSPAHAMPAVSVRSVTLRQKWSAAALRHAERDEYRATLSSALVI